MGKTQNKNSELKLRKSLKFGLFVFILYYEPKYPAQISKLV